MSETKIVALIPARGGSKGVPRKNIKLLGGKPLIEWTIQEAKKLKEIDRIIVSTDDEEIANIAISLGAEVPFLRPKNFALDNTPGVDTALHAIKELEPFDWLLLLQPTSPFRKKKDIKGMIDFALLNNLNSAVSVNEFKINPYLIYEKDKDGIIKLFYKEKNKIFTRQELNPFYKVNGALYFCKRKWLLKEKSFITDHTYAYEMPEDRSLDIDTFSDWQEAEMKIKVKL